MQESVIILLCCNLSACVLSVVDVVPEQNIVLTTHLIGTLPNNHCNNRDNQLHISK